MAMSGATAPRVGSATREAATASRAVCSAVHQMMSCGFVFVKMVGLWRCGATVLKKSMAVLSLRLSSDNAIDLAALSIFLGAC